MPAAEHALHEMLQRASIPALVMCLARITEDGRWLEAAGRVDVLVNCVGGGHAFGSAGLVQPAEIAAAVAFLASDMASGITGIDLPVDLGYLVATPWSSYGGLRGADHGGTP